MEFSASTNQKRRREIIICKTVSFYPLARCFSATDLFPYFHSTFPTIYHLSYHIISLFQMTSVNLPYEILEQVFEYLSPKHLIVASKTCRLWRDVLLSMKVLDLCTFLSIQHLQSAFMSLTFHQLSSNSISSYPPRNIFECMASTTSYPTSQDFNHSLSPYLFNPTTTLRN